MKAKKINFFPIFPLIFTPALSASFFSCSSQNQEETVSFKGDEIVDAVLTDNKWFVEYTGFSFTNFSKDTVSNTLEVGALATFSDEIETQIIYTQNNNFNVRLYVPNSSSFKAGQYNISLVIYNNSKTKTYFNKVLKFNINSQIIIPKEIPILQFQFYNNYYWAACPGFTLKNFKSPYNYGFQVVFASSELGSIKLEFEINNSENQDCNFAILFRSSASYIDITKSYYIILSVPGLEEKTITFEVNSSKLSFENDAWSNVITYANKGFEELKNHYSLSSFIGLKKEIYINKIRYHVQVIGENCDELSKPSEFTKASLTFQFCELISDQYGNSELKPWTNAGFIWSDSDLRKYLNNSETGLLSLFPNEVGLRIKTVKKSCTKFIGSTPQPSIVDDKIWLASNSEISQTSSTDNKRACNYISEGSCYEYYKKAGTIDTQSDIRVKENLAGHFSLYWTRTPELIQTTHGTTYYAYRVHPNGIITNIEMKNGDVGFAPCFCL